MRRRLLAPEEVYPAGTDALQSRFVDTAWGRFRVVSGGPAPADARGTIVLLHGWACAAYAFNRLLPLLLNGGYHCVVPDLPGHGLTDKREDPSAFRLGPMTDAVSELLSELVPGDFTLVGHSMGGRIALELALARQHQVRRLVLFNPVGFGPMPHVAVASRFARPPLISFLPRAMPEAVIRVMLGAVHGRLSTYTLEDVQQYRGFTQGHAFQRCMALLLRNFDWREVADGYGEELRSRTVLLFGELDRVVQAVRAGRVGALQARGWRASVLRDVAHVLQEEVPQVAANAVLGAEL